MMTYLMAIFCGSFFAHWIADFCMQSRRTAETKSYMASSLFFHCVSYAFIMSMSVALLTSNLVDIMYLLLIFWISHIAIDFVSSKISAWLWREGRMHEFFAIIGFDQLLHTSIIFIVVLVSMNWEYERRRPIGFENVKQEIKMKENIALFDLDGTLADYDKALINDLNNIRGPQEGKLIEMPRGDLPSWFSARANLIRSSPDWWANLPQFKLGMDIWELAGDIGFRRTILTAGPKRNPNAWAGKKMWIDNNLGEDVEVTITRDKGLVYGRVLVDDWPEYINRWLEWRPRGLVIMPANRGNAFFHHPQVIRYNGRNLKFIRDEMAELFSEDDFHEEGSDIDDTYIISKKLLVERLAEKYTKSQNDRHMSQSEAVAMICDEVLDKSGEILGRVRREHERKANNY